MPASADVWVAGALALLVAGAVFGVLRARGVSRASAELDQLFRRLGVEPVARQHPGRPGGAPRAVLGGRLRELELSVDLASWQSGRLEVALERPARPLPPLTIEPVRPRAVKKKPHPFQVAEFAAMTIEESVPEELRRGGRAKGVDTSDPELDRRVTVSGDEAQILALLEHAERARLLELLERGALELSEGRLSAATSAREQGEEALAAWVEVAARAAEHLERLDAAELRARLAHNAGHDPEPLVCARNLDVLLTKHAASAEARAARAAALAGDEPETLLVAALHDAPASEAIFERLARRSDASDPVRAAALRELATLAPARHAALFLDAIAGESSLLQAAGTTGLAALELGTYSLERLLDRLDDLGPDAFAATLELLQRANAEEGRRLAPEVRARAIRVLIEHGHLPHAERGRLGLTETAEPGAVSLERAAGAVSVAGEGED